MFLSKENLKALIFASGGFITLWVIFYPGFMSFDSLLQYSQAKSLIFSDWFPPMMAWLWSILDFFLTGPSSMLAFNLFLLWVSIYIWWKSYKSYKLSWLIFLMPFLPWILNFSGVIWKDVCLAFSLFALVSLLNRKYTYGTYIAAFLLAFFAINIRQNALFAVIPICFTFYFFIFKKHYFIAPFLLSIITIGVIFYAGTVFNYKLLHAQKVYPVNWMLNDDLSYLSAKSRKSYFPNVNIEEIYECAANEIGQNKYVGKTGCLSKQPSYASSGIDPLSLKASWIKAVSNNVLDYVRFRLAAFSYLLRSPDTTPFYIWHPGIDDNSYGFKKIPNGASLLAEEYVVGSASFLPFFFKPYWWLYVSTIFLFISFLYVPTRVIIIIRCLLTSSIFYIIGYIPLTPMADFRYIYWSVIASTLASVIFVVTFKSLNINLSRKKIIYTVIFTVIWSLLIFNFYSITYINIDKLIYNAISNETFKKTKLEKVTHSVDVSPRDNDFVANVLSPKLLYELKDLNINIQNARWLKFDFKCSGGSKQTPAVLYWWGDNQVGPTEEQRIDRSLVKGVNTIPMRPAMKEIGTKVFGGLTIQLLDGRNCKKFNIKNLEFYEAFQ